MSLADAPEISVSKPAGLLCGFGDVRGAFSVGGIWISPTPMGVPVVTPAASPPAPAAAFSQA